MYRQRLDEARYLAEHVLPSVPVGSVVDSTQCKSVPPVTAESLEADNSAPMEGPHSVQDQISDDNVQGVPIVDTDYNLVDEGEDSPDDSGSDLEDELPTSFSNTAYVIDKSLSFSDQLARWCTHFKIRGVAFTVLLKIFAVYSIAQGLPLDSRTIMKTSRCIRTKRVSGGEYYHFGLVHGLCLVLSRLCCESLAALKDTLYVSINMDGLPCFKSVSTHIWPILCSLRVRDVNLRPFTVGVFYGVEKDKRVDEYLSDFVDDYNRCREEGFQFKDRRFKVKVWSVICDAPARAFVKNVQPHNAYHSCERCTIKGKKLKGITFNKDNCRLRTDDSIKAMTDEAHHKGPSPLGRCGIKLASEVVIDYMHLVLLGVLRRIMGFLLYADTSKVKSKKRFCRLSLATKGQIDVRLVSFVDTCPSDFSRRPRSLSSFRLWKATELRSLLLYTGVVALRGPIDRRCYDNFKLLMCAMRIMLSNVLSADKDYRAFARKCLSSFVKQYRGLYGKKEVVYNVHNLLHLHKDCKRYGSLDNVSAFQFENHLQSFKGMVRSGHRTMQQIVRRLDESDRHGLGINDPHVIQKTKKMLHKHDAPLPFVLRGIAGKIKAQCKAIKLGLTRYSVFPKDSCIRLPSKDVGKIVNIVMMQDTTVYFVYRQYASRRPYFHYPCNSELIGIYRVANLTDHLQVVDAKKCRKCWLLPSDDDPFHVAVELL